MGRDAHSGELERGATAPADDVTTRPPLRFITCGSVDNGKSTLIGRLLYEQALIFDDRLAAIECDSGHSAPSATRSFRLLLDGLEAEREQGITIDVAYRSFSTAKRSFVVADTPGHEQYTRNMATGASNADLAVILVDARKGLLTQTFRHAAIVSLLGIHHVVLAVNKIDLVGFDQSVFEQLVARFEKFAAKLNFKGLTAIPISARYGDNVSSNSARMPWYRGPNLLAVLEDINVEDELQNRPFRMAVQWVNRPHLDFHGYSGRIASGGARPGDGIVVAGTGRATRIKQILTADGDSDQALASDSVTLVLEDDVDVSRGDMLAAPNGRPEVADQFAAHVIWLSDDRLLPGRSYRMKIGTRTVPATVTEIKHRLDVNTLDKHAAKTLALNEIGFCNLATSAAVVFDAYADNRETGAFILIDRYTNVTAAAGMVAFGLRRATNVHYQDITVTKDARATIKQQRPAIVWFTGLPGPVVDHRQRFGCARAFHNHARWRQRPTRSQQGSRLPMWTALRTSAGLAKSQPCTTRVLSSHYLTFRGTADGRNLGRRGRIRRGFRRHPARGVHRARSQGPL
jgi:bifunctional enzyme CysN/CysC